MYTDIDHYVLLCSKNYVYGFLSLAIDMCQKIKLMIVLELVIKKYNK